MKYDPRINWAKAFLWKSRWPVLAEKRQMRYEENPRAAEGARAAR